MQTLLTIAALIVTGATPGDLLTDMQSRGTFLEKLAPSYVRVAYQPPLKPGEDPDYRPNLQTLGAIVQDDGGKRVLVSEQILAGVSEVVLEFSDGDRVKAKVRHPERGRDVPMAQAVPVDARALAKRPALRWRPRKELKEGLRLWAVEFPTPRQLPDGQSVAVLVDAVLGPPVEHPLERFFYVAVDDAEGLALVDHEGQVACIVFRTVPLVDKSSLCTPGDAALTPGPDRDAPGKTEKLDLKTSGGR